MWDFAACKKIFLCWIPPCVIETLPPPIQTPPVATEERRRKQEAESEEDRGFGFFLPSLRRKCLCSSAAFRSDRGNSCVQRQNFPIENKSYETILYRLRKGDFLRLKRGGEKKDGFRSFSMQKLQFFPGGIPDLDSIFCQDLQQKSHWTNAFW